MRYKGVAQIRDIFFDSHRFVGEFTIVERKIGVYLFLYGFTDCFAFRFFLAESTEAVACLSFFLGSHCDAFGDAFFSGNCILLCFCTHRFFFTVGRKIIS